MDDQTPPARFPRLRPASPLGVLLLGSALLVLLGLVAAAARGHHTPGSGAGIRQPPSGVGDYVFSILAVVVVVSALFLLYLWFSERDMLAEQRRRRQGKGAYKAIAILMFIGLVAALVAHFHLGFGGAFKRLRAQGTHPNAGQRLKQLTHKAGPQHPPHFQWLPVLITTGAGTVLLGFIGARTLRRSHNELMAKHVLEQEFAELIDETLEDLRAEKDPRRAIIKAYARMERLFETYGVPRSPAEAPMEYLGRALHELRASGAALGRLTGLFQWAKFSSHDVDESMREDAIAALTQVRDELRANRQEDEVRRAEAEALRREQPGAVDDSEDGRTFGENPFDAANEKMKGSVYTQR